jgi:aryl-alcohol dehydrogenase-like predicted oxidoreductase
MGTVRAEPRLWERYLERGGTAFDTARHYGDASESALGTLVERHGDRRGLVLVGKGAHSPFCAPKHVAPQLERSLELLRTGYLDVYLLHRDNPAVPVAEWVDALEPHVESGRARAIGASNWTPERYHAYNRAAIERGATPFSLLSNQLSLAESLAPVWEGCLAADETWHERTQTPLLAWSAQARGFFAGRAEDRELRRSWLSSANLERRRRAEELGERHAVAAVTIALAWLLARPFPIHAVVGPRDEKELAACLAALDVELTDDEVRWLTLEP